MEFSASRYTVRHPEKICTPSFLVYGDIVRENTRNAIKAAGGADKLWPHVKSHKMADMVKMQMELGIRRFKCATLPEARMTAKCGADAVLLAYPLVGPNIALFLRDSERFPKTRFYAIGDSLEAVEALSKEAEKRGVRVKLLADVNLGMNRTGAPLDGLQAFIEDCESLPGIEFAGLHLYDGHRHETDPILRKALAEKPMREVFRLRDEMPGGKDWLLVAGGSPTMPCHADEGVFLSPGTVFFWDAGYAESYPEMPYTPAAAVMTRVVSHPAAGMFTLDLGCKAIACDPAGSRGVVAGLQGASVVMQNEEHWVFRMDEGRESERPAIGSVFYVIPTHVCPTTALYANAVVIENGEIAGVWPVTARDRDCLTECAD